MKYYTPLALLLALGLVGCKSTEMPEADAKVRERIFFECLQKAPAGPQSAHYNDWAEVVSNCDNSAYYIALNYAINAAGKKEGAQ